MHCSQLQVPQETCFLDFFYPVFQQDGFHDRIIEGQEATISVLSAGEPAASVTAGQVCWWTKISQRGPD